MKSMMTLIDNADPYAKCVERREVILIWWNTLRPIISLGFLLLVNCAENQENQEIRSLPTSLSITGRRSIGNGVFVVFHTYCRFLAHCC